jgi:hypothetical protein
VKLFVPVQVTVAVMVCGWAHVLHGLYKPWGAGSETYYVQHFALFVTTFIFVMGLLFKVGGGPAGFAISWSSMACASSALSLN